METLSSKQFEYIFTKLEKQEAIFKDKSLLDTLVFPQNVVGREEKIEEILKHLIGYKQGYVKPLISIYGRSGSGKSTLVKLVCENLDDVEYGFVNLRKAKTVFGSANLILAELGISSIKSAKGLNVAVDLIGDSIISKLAQVGKKVFLLVLDEVDVLFNDTRGNPSDFIYKLLILEEKLRSAGFLMSIITISNNLLSDFILDDRIRSRIGTCEVFFESYKKDQVLEILRNIAKNAFSIIIDDKVLEQCAEISSAEHGDARRAIELLKISSEIAGSSKLTPEHVTKAHSKLQKDTFVQYFQHASQHSKVVMLAIARLSYLTDEHLHSTSRIYKQYCSFKEKPLSYRRVSDLLSELAQGGILSSSTKSNGRYGYGTQYELRIPPYMILQFYKKIFEELQKNKKRHLEHLENPKYRNGIGTNKAWNRYYTKVSWREHVERDKQTRKSSSR